jgi:flagellar biosynthetic protein FliP
MNTKKLIILAISFIYSFVFFDAAFAQEELRNFAEGLPALTIKSNSDTEQTYSLSLQILALMTGLTLLPSIVLGATSFTRIIIVLSILRQAMGTQQTPPNQVLIAIALFLTFFIMTPTLTEINNTALTGIFIVDAPLL